MSSPSREPQISVSGLEEASLKTRTGMPPRLYFTKGPAELFLELCAIWLIRLLQERLTGKERVVDYHHLKEYIGRQWPVFKKIVFDCVLQLDMNGFLLFQLLRNGCLQALLSLYSDELVSFKGDLNLISQQLPENASQETIGRAYHTTETFVQFVQVLNGGLW